MLGGENKAATKHYHEEERKSNLRRAITSSVKRIKGLFKRQGNQTEDKEDEAKSASELAVGQKQDSQSTNSFVAQLDHDNYSAMKEQHETAPYYVAIYDYDARTSEELAFQKGN